jgi:CheY-like chemotaxis protein
MAVGQVFTAERPISATVLIVDDEDASRSLCHDVVTDSGLRTRTASTTEQALKILDQMPVDILITDLRLPQIGGLELRKRVRSTYPQTAVLVLTQYGTIESAVEATGLGAADYITKPFHIPELRSKLDRLIRLLDVDQENRVLRETRRTRPGFADLTGVSLKMQRVYRWIGRVSQDPYPVLILGESGTGKELVARRGEFIPLAACLVERRLRRAQRSASSGGSPWADMPDDVAEIFRHEINSPLTGILGNAELLLSHGVRLPGADTQRLQTVVDLAVRLRETIRRFGRLTNYCCVLFSCCAAAAAWAFSSSASRSLRERNCPASITPEIFCVFSMFCDGSASSKTMSARRPAAMLPISFLPRNSAGFSVADCRASCGVSPAATNSLSS